MSFGWQIDKEALGRDSTTVFRDKSGKRRNLAAEQEEEAEEARKKAEEDKKYQEWGQGYVLQYVGVCLSVTEREGGERERDITNVGVCLSVMGGGGGGET